MNTQPNAVPEPAVDLQGAATATLSPTRPLYWSVRRELWENRSIHIAPLVVAAVFLFGFLISTITLPRRMDALFSTPLDPAKQRNVVAMPYSIAASMIILAG